MLQFKYIDCWTFNKIPHCKLVLPKSNKLANKLHHFGQLTNKHCNIYLTTLQLYINVKFSHYCGTPPNKQQQQQQLT